MSEDSTRELRRIAESLDLLVKFSLAQLKGERSIRDMIIELDGMGVAPGKIATLLGTTTENVYPTLSRARRGSTKTAKKPSKSRNRS